MMKVDIQGLCGLYSLIKLKGMKNSAVTFGFDARSHYELNALVFSLYLYTILSLLVKARRRMMMIAFSITLGKIM